MKALPKVKVEKPGRRGGRIELTNQKEVNWVMHIIKGRTTTRGERAHYTWPRAGELYL
jgi:hypothetical protein